MHILFLKVTSKTTACPSSAIASTSTEGTMMYTSVALLPHMFSNSSKPSSLALVTTFKMLIASLRMMVWSLSNFFKRRCKSCIPTPALSTKAASKCSGKSSQICHSHIKYVYIYFLFFWILHITLGTLYSWISKNFTETSPERSVIVNVIKSHLQNCVHGSLLLHNI